jgi:transposase
LATKKHECRWRTTAAKLERELADKGAQISALSERLNALEHKLAHATKQIIGPKSERTPTPEEEAKKREGKKPKRGGHTNPKKRKENAEALAALPTTEVPHPIPESERTCPHCGDEVRPMGNGERSIEYEWLPGRLVRRVHVVEVGRCPCKMHYARGPAPRRVKEGCTYGPAFLAKLANDKCADATPIYRVEKAMRRAGIPISRSTMNDLVLFAADACEPLWRAMLAEVRIDAHVQADETSRTQAKVSRCFVWTFLSRVHTAYVFSASRSGDTPKEILGGTTGWLTIDGYTGYNVVTDVDGRERSGCWSHARRYLFDALATAPEARDGLDIILDLFMIEREAKCTNIVGTREHLALRRKRSAPVIARLRAWREAMAPQFEPKSPMGEALRYMKNQWTRLTAFLEDPLIPIHNNASEAALRIALFRKNSLFFGNKTAARRFMILYSLIATCERHDVNPEAYLADILLRIQDHPKDRVAELLPDRWKDSHPERTRDGPNIGRRRHALDAFSGGSLSRTVTSPCSMACITTTGERRDEGGLPGDRARMAKVARTAHRACVLLGIIATCRALRVPAQAYLAWAFERLGTHRDVFDLPLEALTPAAFKKSLK